MVVRSRHGRTQHSVTHFAKGVYAPGVHQAPPQINDPEVICVRVPPGIGDISWVHSKLVTTGKKLHYFISGGGPKRSIPFLDLLPEVAGATYGEFSYLQFAANQLNPVIPCAALTNDCWVSLNEFLEQGNRIELAFPGMSTNLHYDINIPADDVATAEALVAPYAGHSLFGYYTSSKMGARNWGGWLERDWLDFYKALSKTYPHIPVIIGATFDSDLTGEVRRQFLMNNVPHIYLVGQNIGQVLHLLKTKRIEFLHGFASGICIVTNVCGVACSMQYPHKLDKLRHAWHDPMIPYLGWWFDRVENTVPLVEPVIANAKKAGQRLS